MNPEQPSNKKETVPIRLQQLTEADAERYGKYWETVALAYPEEYGLLAQKVLEGAKIDGHDLLRTRRASQSSFLGLTEKNEIAGMIGMDTASSNTNSKRTQGVKDAEITSFSVHPEYLGKGVGENMLHDFIKQAKQSGLHQLFLYVRTENLAAKRLYEKLDFQPTGEMSVNEADGKTMYEEYILSL